ncbi:unnamed protein product [Notodromas monacha]|uniref:Uncharacterized protein n=1 Tax=Notodromas monacha TaxID=399045 RepID=A0A7R9BLD7_9CRUS|nr:unnamed protein product [Notodromas monacha]CAG0917623.1 unnamed protein product [Notodromas monacha]
MASPPFEKKIEQKCHCRRNSERFADSLAGKQMSVTGTACTSPSLSLIKSTLPLRRSMSSQEPTGDLGAGSTSSSSSSASGSCHSLPGVISGLCPHQVMQRGHVLHNHGYPTLPHHPHVHAHSDGSSGSSSPSSSVPNSPAMSGSSAGRLHRPSSLHGLKHKLQKSLHTSRRKSVGHIPLSPLARTPSPNPALGACNVPGCPGAFVVQQVPPPLNPQLLHHSPPSSGSTTPLPLPSPTAATACSNTRSPSPLAMPFQQSVQSFSPGSSVSLAPVSAKKTFTRPKSAEPGHGGCVSPPHGGSSPLLRRAPPSPLALNSSSSSSSSSSLNPRIQPQPQPLPTVLVTAQSPPSSVCSRASSLTPQSSSEKKPGDEKPDSTSTSDSDTESGGSSCSTLRMDVARKGSTDASSSSSTTAMDSDPKSPKRSAQEKRELFKTGPK